MASSKSNSKQVNSTRANSNGAELSSRRVVSPVTHQRPTKFSAEKPEATVELKRAIDEENDRVSALMTAASVDEDSSASGGDNDPDIEDDEPVRAPSELLMEFLHYVMTSQWASAKKTCEYILKFEPENARAKQFYPLILERMKMEKEAEEESEADEDADNDDDVGGDVDDGKSDSGSELFNSSDFDSDSDDDNDDEEGEDDDDDGDVVIPVQPEVPGIQQNGHLNH